MPPIRDFIAGRHEAVKALNENELHHAYSIYVVSMVTGRFVLWFPN